MVGEAGGWTVGQSSGGAGGWVVGRSGGWESAIHVQQVTLSSLRYTLRCSSSGGTGITNSRVGFSFGDLYVFEKHLCFDWKVFGFHKQQVVELENVLALLKSNEVPNTVEVQVRGYSLELTLPENFDEAYSLTAGKTNNFGTEAINEIVPAPPGPVAPRRVSYIEATLSVESVKSD